MKSASIEQKLQEKYKGQLDDVHDVEELILDELVRTESISDSDKKYLERFKSLSILSMDYLGLTTVQNMPEIPTITEVF